VAARIAFGVEIEQQHPIVWVEKDDPRDVPADDLVRAQVVTIAAGASVVKRAMRGRSCRHGRAGTSVTRLPGTAREVRAIGVLPFLCPGSATNEAWDRGEAPRHESVGTRDPGRAARNPHRSKGIRPLEAGFPAWTGGS